MIAVLYILKTYLKPILIALSLVIIYFSLYAFKLQVLKVKQLEQTVQQKDIVISEKQQKIAEAEDQVQRQTAIILKLQSTQAQIQKNTQQKLQSVKEIVSHDYQAQTWASQPIPDSFIRLLNSSTQTSQ